MPYFLGPSQLLAMLAIAHDFIPLAKQHQTCDFQICTFQGPKDAKSTSRIIKRGIFLKDQRQKNVNVVADRTF